MRRRLLKLFWVLAAGLGLSAAASPWWLGAALRSAGASRGLTFARYERVGYSRFALHEAAFSVNGVRATVARIEADTPLVGWWRRGEIVGGRWAVDVAGRAAETGASPTRRGWVSLRAQLQAMAGHLGRWAPRVKIEAGVVRWSGTELTCAAAVWANRELVVKDLAYRGLQADAALAFPVDAVRLGLRGSEAEGHFESRGAEVTGAVLLWAQHATLRARFGGEGWLPAEAALEAENWSVPGERLKLGDGFAAVRARGKVDWYGDRIFADFSAAGEPIPGKTVPPLEATLRGQGDAEAFTVETLHATLPGIVARLSEAVTVERSGKFRPSGARFTVEADLAKQPWFTAQGTVSGEARLATSFSQTPVVEFQLRGRDIASTGWEASLIAAKGDFAWPRVRVSEGAVTGTAGESLVWRGGWNFETKEMLDAAAEGQIRRATVGRWVPASVGFDAVALKVVAAGRPTDLVHTGRAEAAGVTFPGVNPLSVTVAWSGRGGALESLDVDAAAGTTVISAGGAVKDGAVQLTKLALAQGGVERLHLTEPATIRWRPGFEVDALHLSGPESAVDASLVWGETGRLELAAKNFSSVWLGELAVWRGPAWRLASLTAKGTWARGPMAFALKSTAAIEVGAGKSAVVAAAASGDSSGVRIEELSVLEEGKSVVRVVGRFPLRVSPAATPVISFEPEGALALDGTTVPNAGFWRQWAELTGFEAQEPEASVHVTGTWARPQGTFHVKAGRVSVDAGRFKRPIPTVDTLDVEIAGTAGELRLERLTAKVEGQTVLARGRVPVGEGRWRDFLASPLAWLQGGAEGRLEVPDADVAGLARFLPVWVAPQGRLQLDLNVKAGGVSGAVKLRDAATRPLGPLGVLQEIHAEVALAGRKLELRSVTAQSGGQWVTARGTVELPEAAAKTGGVEWAEGVKFNVALQGENLPFVRQTGVLVRGDLDLTLTSPDGRPPLIAGKVRLRESLFLSDIRALVPGGARTRARTPPYFAVEAVPYAAWRLDVGVAGEKFLNLRTALFTGVASANFRLGGTLGEPALRGEATIDEGAVKLPFATFAVQEGWVSLTPEQGAEPQVWLVGTVRRLNYDLRMEASGPASAPALMFSSSPPLESAQVLLMVMAGEAPHDEVTYSDRQRVARLGSFLGQSLLASFGGESEAGERVSLSAGENISRQGRETYGIEYRLSDRWSVVGEFDEFDEFNVGLKWRVFSKGGTREERKQ